MRRTFAVALVALALTGCATQQEARFTEEETENIDEGDFVLQMEVAPGELGEVEGRLRDWPVERVISDLNDWLALPNDVTVILDSTSSPDDFYFDPEADEIVASYESVDRDRRLFAASGEEGDDAWEAALTNFELFLYHEAGHALVDSLGLRVTGKEEDAADGFAALVAIQLLSDGRGLLFNAIEFQRALAGRSNETQAKFADEHFLDEQRLHQFLCWVYGSDAETYDWIISKEYLPADGADACDEEYSKHVAAWVERLGDYLKKTKWDQ